MHLSNEVLIKYMHPNGFFYEIDMIQAKNIYNETIASPSATLSVLRTGDHTECYGKLVRLLEKHSRQIPGPEIYKDPEWNNKIYKFTSSLRWNRPEFLSWCEQQNQAFEEELDLAAEQYERYEEYIKEVYGDDPRS